MNFTFSKTFNANKDPMTVVTEDFLWDKESMVYTKNSEDFYREGEIHQTKTIEIAYSSSKQGIRVVVVNKEVKKTELFDSEELFNKIKSDERFDPSSIIAIHNIFNRTL